MQLLDWTFIGFVSGAVLFLLFGAYALFQVFSFRKKWQVLKRKRPPKDKKKRRRFLFLRRHVDLKRKKWRLYFIVNVILVLVTSASAFYIRYYQLMYLGSEDVKLITTSYYLVNESQKHLHEIKAGVHSENTLTNLRELSSQLTSVGTRFPSEKLSVKGQSLLKKYYATIQNFGINLYSQSEDALKKEEIMSSYEADLEKIITTREQVFAHFKVDEALLQQKK